MSEWTFPAYVPIAWALALLFVTGMLVKVSRSPK